MLFIQSAWHAKMAHIRDMIQFSDLGINLTSYIIYEQEEQYRGQNRALRYTRNDRQEFGNLSTDLYKLAAVR